MTPPPALLAAAERVGLPVVGLPTEVPFVAITKSVHASIVSSSYAELQDSERLHELFARRGTDDSPPERVVEDAAALAGAPVVLESLDHRVLAAALAGRDAGAVLADWESRSRRALATRTTPSVSEGWLVRRVAVRDLVVGRLVLLPGSGVTTTRLQVLTVERAAEALALGRLLRGDAPALEDRAEGRLLRDLAGRRHRTDAEAHPRAGGRGPDGAALADRTRGGDRRRAAAGRRGGRARCRTAGPTAGVCAATPSAVQLLLRS